MSGAIPKGRLEELQARCDYSIEKNKGSLSHSVPELLREIARLKKQSECPNVCKTCKCGESCS